MVPFNKAMITLCVYACDMNVDACLYLGSYVCLIVNTVREHVIRIKGQGPECIPSVMD